MMILPSEYLNWLCDREENEIYAKAESYREIRARDINHYMNIEEESSIIFLIRCYSYSLALIYAFVVYYYRHDLIRLRLNIRDPLEL
ncbi:hypothetical protein LSH36_38g02018 [Paralvinella palmiformis]|uniref:Uncharacterized protein n=1 Tax=Paralvinella palmiformis TaxID=53620 RepID=A0AAD9K8A6_9ANNE|nr:hypothetical protein LSH36_38g02018 [Paralvinella palmiformis]